MATDYALNLRATLDTTLVKQQLQQLRSALSSSYSVGDQVGNPQMGLSHMQKIEVQLTRLGLSISSLQRAIEQLAKAETRVASAGNSQPTANGQSALPVVPLKAFNGKANWKDWLDSKQYRKFNNLVKNILSNEFEAVEQQVLMYRTGIRDLKDPQLAHKLLSSPFGKEMFGRGFNYEKEVAKYQEKQQAAQREAMKSQQASMRQNRLMAAIIGGLILGGIGSYATDFGYTRTGAVASGLGSGVTAGGGAALGATMLGAGASAATGVGLVVGIVAAATAITKAFMELEESAKKAAEAQTKIVETLRSNAIGLSLDMYGMWQRQRAEEVQKQNNLPVAKERAEYFKKAFEEARTRFYQIGDPVKYEKKIREDAEKKKNSTVDDFYVQGSMQSGFTEVHFLRERTDEEKAAIDKAANEAIEAQQKKFAAAKRELQAAEANAQVWKEVADKLEESKKAGEKLTRIRLNEEAAQRNALVRQSSDLKYVFKDEESIRSTQVLANDILNEKNGPLSAFNKLSEELDKLRAERKDLRTQAFSINREMELNGRSKTSIELKDMARRRDYLLLRSNVIGERADILETALGSIDTSKLAHKPDLSHVTSLALYGFNMGEKDNSVERMEKYYTKSINLQQLIKDKLQEGIKTEAIYSL